MTAVDQPTGEPAPAPAEKTAVNLPTEARHWLDLITSCTERIADLEEQKAVARRHLEQWLGEAEVGVLDERPVVRWSYVSSTRLDTTKLKQSEPEVWARYARTTTSRRFTPVTEDPA